MKAAIITVAGISSRFNEGVEDRRKALKAIYTTDLTSNTLLFHLLNQCRYADRIIVVGGYRFEKLKSYMEREVSGDIRDKVVLIFNKHYMDLASGYSLYLAAEEALKLPDLEEVLFVEGDLDIDRESFQKMRETKSTVLTYNYEPIYSNKAVVFYQNKDGKYKYEFNTCHGFLKIEEPFSCILNSGQMWKFWNIDGLRNAVNLFYEHGCEGTNLKIVQNYLDSVPKEEIRLLGLKQWANCNTREDYKKIRKRWDEEER